MKSTTTTNLDNCNRYFDPKQAQEIKSRTKATLKGLIAQLSKDEEEI